MADKIFCFRNKEFQESETTWFSGANLAVDIFENVASEFYSAKYLFLIAFGIGSCVCCIPFAFRKIEKDALFGEEPKERALTVLLYIFTVYYLITIFIFFINSPREFSR